MNDRKIFTIEDVINAVRDNPETMLAVDKDGNIRNCVTFKKVPASNEGFDILIRNEKNKGCAVSFIKQDINITEQKVIEKIKRSIDSLRYSRTHNLSPGVNIPEINSKGLRKIWWKLKLFYHLYKIKIQAAKN